MVEIFCTCGRSLRFEPRFLGRAVACPACRKRLRAVAAGYNGDAPTFDAAFVVEEGPRREGEYILIGGNESIEIGKEPERHVRLYDRSVSRLHCRLVRTEVGWRIEDNRSTNGLFVNGRRVKGRNLLEGDQVRIGCYVLKLAKAVGPPPTVAPVAAEDVSPDGSPDQSMHDRLNFIDDLAAASMTVTSQYLPPGPPPVAEPVKPGDEDDFFRFADDDLEAGPPTAASASRPVGGAAASSGTARTTAGVGIAGGPGSVICPSCGKPLPDRSKICIDCGVNVQTGRSLLTAQGRDLDAIYDRALRIIWPLSFIDPIGAYPVASEAFGTHRPHTVRAIALVTVLITAWYLSLEYTNSPKLMTAKNLMLWTGDQDPAADDVVWVYEETNYGDAAAFRAKLDEIKQTGNLEFESDQVVAAYHALPPEKRCFGEYRPSQLITHAFLHADPIHLLGNLFFLMIFGTRVNALIGNLATLAVYPLLAIGAAITQMQSVADGPPIANLGASGAVMGMAGMYLVLFPAHKMHVLAWVRWGIINFFRLSHTIFAISGFWVVLFYIGLDVLYTMLSADDGVAHWAHIGGAIVGAAFAVIMLLTRLVNARGGDIFSLVLGRHAWALVGRPSRHGE